MVSPEAVARRPMKAVKSITITAVPCALEGKKNFVPLDGLNSTFATPSATGFAMPVSNPNSARTSYLPVVLRF
jgi:hypothetical protein